ncbi:PREDICTED: B-cell receptor CD22-like [Gekko japonicus]|uniref:B-cell receptor CD22 n=1 Tax=Gekko japonicus TaxID=146911 RepID=A0ABM1L4D1_GEKJA|nr:PREDICTED: B-cell receptor CD22-like [Gekko japonicus]
MKNLVWLLFLPGFLCNPNPLKINPDSLVAWKGSCVVIPCQINRYDGALLRDISLRWYFQPFNDTKQSDYSGHLLCNSSSTSRKCSTPSPSAFAGRLAFVGNVQNNLEKKTCSLKISQARTEDSGIYGARLSASYLWSVQRFKWFLNATVNVTESPPDPKMDINPKNIREGWTRVTCSVPYHCPEEPLGLTISGLGGTRLTSTRTTINNGMIQTVVILQMTWEDHGKSLVCSLKRQNGSEISKSTMQLDVKYAPKDLQVIASPGTILRAGETLSLECMINSSNPEVSEYLWYKDDQLMDEWMNDKKMEFKTEGDWHSGAYRCEAKNSIGSPKSSELSINVQSHLHYPSDPAASGLEPTTENEGPQSSPLLPSTPEGVSSLLPSTSYPLSLSELPPSGVPVPPLPSSQEPCDGRTLMEEFSFLSESLDQIVKAQNQFIHSSQVLTSAVVQLTQKLQEALLQKRQETRVVPSKIKKQTTSNNGVIQTVVNLQMSWEDHGKSLICSLKKRNWSEISKSTMQLDVKYAPKDVRVIASPGTIMREGETLSLECRTKSSNPEVSEYLWYKDDQLMDDQPKLKRIEFETEGDKHSGAYRCEAKNSVGSLKSEELRIDVQCELIH